MQSLSAFQQRIKSTANTAHEPEALAVLAVSQHQIYFMTLIVVGKRRVPSEENRQTQADPCRVYAPESDRTFAACTATRILIVFGRNRQAT